MDFLNRLIVSRKKLGTQKEVAEKIGVSHATISRVEKGSTKTFDFKFLKYLAENGIDLNWLFTGKETNTNSTDPQQLLIIKEAFEIKYEALNLKIDAQKELLYTKDKEIEILKLELEAIKKKLK